jgi:hypothetical protein
LLSAVSTVYRNRIVLNNIDKLQNVNGDINGMLTLGGATALATAEKELMGKLVPDAQAKRDRFADKTG